MKISEIEPEIRRIRLNDEADFEEQVMHIKPTVNRNMEAYGIFVNDQLVGVCRINLNPFDITDVFAINFIGVNPLYRNQKLGDKLLKHVCSIYGSLGATTGSKSNPIIKNLLIKYGFKIKSKKSGVIYWIYNKN